LATREADDSPPSRAEVIPPFPPYTFVAWHVIKHKDNLKPNVAVISDL
jgi:hypothetical protein